MVFVAAGFRKPPRSDSVHDSDISSWTSCNDPVGIDVLCGEYSPTKNSVYLMLTSRSFFKCQRTASPVAVLLLAACVAAFFVAVPAAGQPADRALPVAESTADSLGADDEHSYTIDLAADRFVYGVAEQHTVDVVIEVHSPDGSELARIDVTGEGPEPFQFETEAEGVHRLVVTSFEEDAGRYTLRLDGAEPIATAPSDRVRQLVHRVSGDAPGVAVGVVKDGSLIYTEAFGMADLTTGTPFTVDTRSNIGSVSKQFTAMGVLLLAQDGQLSLDDPVTKHLPNVKAFEDTVRIRHLLTHTSGYRESINTLAMAGVRFDRGDYISQEDIVDVVQRQPELQNKPGTKWNYNNTGYQLLADVIATVSGMSFPEYMDDRVFGPLGMNRTMIRAPRSQVVPGSARGYTMSDGSYREGIDLPAAMGAGGIYATLSDLAKWIDNFNTHELGGPGAYEQMTTPYVLANGDTTAYGLGVFVQDIRGLKTIQHGGADMAHRAQVTYFPELNAGIIMMTNNATAPGSLPLDVAEAFFGDDMEPVKPGSAAPADTSTASFEPADMTAEDFESFVGRYELDNVPGFVLTFMQEDGTYYTQATGQPRLEIRPTGPSTFELVRVEARVEFQDVEDGKAQSLTLFQNGVQTASRIKRDPWSPTSDSLKAYEGRYYSEELQTAYVMTVREGQLVLTHTRLDDITLKPGQEDQFSGAFPVMDVEFVRDEAGKVMGLRAGNGRTSGVRFDKVE